VACATPNCSRGGRSTPPNAWGMGGRPATLGFSFSLILLFLKKKKQKTKDLKESKK
jgi:hypothetical protein